MGRKVRSATARRDLRSGISVWQADRAGHVPAYALTRSLKVDVAIVGAGISGAFMAHSLGRQFGKVAVFDGRPPLHGSTMASTCMLQFEIDTPLTALSDRIGAAKATRAWLRSWRATRELVRLVERAGMRCGLKRSNALYLSGDEFGHRALEQEHAARKRAGLPGDYLSKKQLRDSFGIDREGAILSPDCACADPVRLAAGLLRRASKDGVKVYAPVTIGAVLATPHGVALDAGGHFVEARHCVFCTGYELLKGVPRKGVKIVSSWAIASEPRARYPAWLDKTLIWEASDPYLYLRTTPDRRILAGGEDEDDDSPARRASAMKTKGARLKQKLEKLLPDVDFVPGKTWAGAFGESVDGLPIIDDVPGMPNCTTVMGIGGNGTIYSFIAAQLVSRSLAGHPDKDRDLYRFR
jgi:glycine/D-amino acid oxidase-like deaminating enzyme